MSTEDEQKDKADREREKLEQASLPYKWSQTLPEVTIILQFPQGTKGRDCRVDIKKKKLLVGLKGQTPIIDGELPKDVKVEDSSWTIESGELTVTLLKINKQEWWPHVITTAPKLDTTKIQPEPTSNLSDLDPETAQMVEKMMFDQRAKAQGLPTSEERQKNEMLEKFKAAHPELKFDENTKIH